MLNQQTPLKTSRLRSKTRKESHQISRDSSLLVSNSRTAEPSPITTSRKSPLSISFSDLEEVCKSSSRPSLVKPSPLMLSQQTPLRMSKLKSKIRKEFPQISRDLSLLESNLKMEELFQTTIFKKSPLFTWSSDLEEVCKSSSRPSLEKLSPSMLKHLIPTKMLKRKFRTRRIFH